MLCPTARTHLSTLRTQTDDFTRAYEEGKHTGDFTRARILKRAILEKQAELELLLDPLREVLTRMEAPTLREQYDTIRTQYEDLGILTTLSSGERGITDPEGHEYPFPAYQDIIKQARENREVLTRKAEQGFVRLQITPFAHSISTLKDTYARELKARHSASTLTSTDGTTLDLNTDEPVWMWDGYTNQTPVYFPREFSKTTHGGITKQDALKRDGGFRILMTEDLTDIPRIQGEQTTIGGRKQLDAKGDAITSYRAKGQDVACPSEYLTALHTDPTYAHEEGYTPEDWLMQAILRMRTSGVVLDDYQAKDATGTPIGSACYAFGAYFPVSGVVPYGCWYRDRRRAVVGRDDAGDRFSGVGVRSAVRVKKA